MHISKVISFLERLAPPSLQENYDNAGLLTGNIGWECSGIITSLDVTEAVVIEAKQRKCNLIVVHHPIIFKGIKNLTGTNYIEKTIINAIKNDIAIYAIHTNLDNVLVGVNGKIADKLGLKNQRVLVPKENILKKLVFFVPATHVGEVKEALFNAGAGHIGNYSECSFSSIGEGTFKAGHIAQPFIGDIDTRHTAAEVKVEMIFQYWKQKDIINALMACHPYEEVAYDLIALDNEFSQVGSGLLGDFEHPISEMACLQLLKDVFGLAVIRHTAFTGNLVSRVALCGGSGSFLIHKAIAAGAQLYITADVKYHEFFDANNRLMLADIGHYESEQFTIDLLFDILKVKFTTFAILKTGLNTNPVNYFR